jgi:hypothetical protein
MLEKLHGLVFKSGETWLAVLPFYHSYALNVTIHMGLHGVCSASRTPCFADRENGDGPLVILVDRLLTCFCLCLEGLSPCDHEQI